MFPANPGVRSLQKQDKLIGQYMSVFPEMWKREVNLFPSAGYNPLRIRLKLIRATMTLGLVAVEMADPPSDFDAFGTTVRAFGSESDAGRIMYVPTPPAAQRTQFRGGLFWKSTDFTLSGDPGVVSGNTLTLNPPEAYTNAQIVSAAGIVKTPFFRLRRAHDTPVAGEVLGVGTGVQTSFSFQTANPFVCPGSVRISFTDPVGLKTDLIQDNGYGQLYSAPPDLLIEGENTINYETGEIILNFAAEHIPTASNITIDYEYASEEQLDFSEYDVDWDVDE